MQCTVYILGSAQDGGLPQLGARGGADAAARAQPARRRLGPSLCVLAADGRALLIDASPDLKLQESRLLGVPAYAARDPARNPFDAVLLTHAHMGHYAGLVHFGREAAATRRLPCYASSRMAGFLRDNAPWSQLVRLEQLALHGPGAAELEAGFEPWAGLRVRAIAVPHRAEQSDTLALSLNETLLYVPDIDAWELWPAAREEIARHAICLLDGTFFAAGELRGRDPREVPHPPVTGTLERFGDLARGRRLVLTHLNHTNPLCDPASAAARSVAAAGFEVAAEMMAFEV